MDTGRPQRGVVLPGGCKGALGWEQAPQGRGQRVWGLLEAPQHNTAMVGTGRAHTGTASCRRLRVAKRREVLTP